MNRPSDPPNTASSGDPEGRPEWSVRARELERAGRLEEAEQMMLQHVDHIGVYASIAGMYAERMRRLTAAGDLAGADDARAAACRWIDCYAASATSGGEGLALSWERDRFIAELGGRRRREG